MAIPRQAELSAPLQADPSPGVRQGHADTVPPLRGRRGLRDRWPVGLDAGRAFVTASEASSESPGRRPKEHDRIRAEFYEKKAARHREERDARATPPLPPVTEEEAAQAEPGATAAPGVAATHRPASAQEILRITDPMSRGIPHDPARTAASRRRFLKRPGGLRREHPQGPAASAGNALEPPQQGGGDGGGEAAQPHVHPGDVRQRGLPGIPWRRQRRSPAPPGRPLRLAPTRQAVAALG